MLISEKGWMPRVLHSTFLLQSASTVYSSSSPNFTAKGRRAGGSREERQSSLTFPLPQLGELPSVLSVALCAQSTIPLLAFQKFFGAYIFNTIFCSIQTQ